VNAAAQKQMGRLWHTTNIYMHSPIHEYAEKLALLLPDPLKVIYLTNSGSEANDLAMLMARVYTGNFDVITFRGGYHGASPYAMGLTSMAAYKYPIATGIGCHTGIGGVVQYPKGFLKEAYRLVRERGGVCIADETIEEDGLQQNSAQVGTYLLTELAKLRDKFDIIGDVRGKGLLIGVEMVKDKVSREPLPGVEMNEIFEDCKDMGLLTGKGGVYGQPLKICGVQAHIDPSQKKRVALDIDFSYNGNVTVKVQLNKFSKESGVNNICISGLLRIVLEPLSGNASLVEAVTFYFLQRPHIVIEWSGLATLLNIEGLRTIADNIILEIVDGLLLLPRRYTVPLVPDLNILPLFFPIPMGIVRIFLIEAEELMRSDLCDESDAYTVIHLGEQTWRSTTIFNSQNPQWNEIFEVNDYTHVAIVTLLLKMERS
ncbi:UNVERIFIED_CONTAM: hypothetical protein FKN15_064131, partial [Acipenser sinensis]